MTSVYSLWQSIVKEFEYIGKLAVNPVEIEFHERELTLTPPKEIKISELFFRSAVCKQCGRCCGKFDKVKYWCIFSESDLKNIEFKLPANTRVKWRKEITEDVIKVDGREYPIYYFKHDKEHCQFLKDNKVTVCELHQCKPLHCRFPPIKLKQIKDRVYVTKEAYGRNYRFGCPIKFKPFDRQEFENWDLAVFAQLKNISMDYNINNRVLWLVGELIKRAKPHTEKQLKILECMR